MIRDFLLIILGMVMGGGIMKYYDTIIIDRLAAQVERLIALGNEMMAAMERASGTDPT